MKEKKSSVFNSFLEAIGNIFIFLPYFFSVPTLIKTLFSPWKNIKVQKTIRGFSFAEYFGRFSFNVISRMMGFMMRTSILIFFLIVEIIYTVVSPLLFLLFVILYPLILFLRKASKSEEEIKAELKTEFVKKHLLHEEYREGAAQWFEYIYATHIKTTPWWKLKKLFSIPPVARDWAKGFTPTLDEFTEDLTKTEYQLSIRNHIIGRESESQLIERVLSQSEEANAIIVGEDGVGKRTIINGFSKKIYEGRTNPLLAYKRLLKLNMEKILTRHTDIKEREHFFEELMSEAVEAKNVILLIENFEKYVSSGEGHIDLTTSIAKFAKSPHVQFLAITTPFFYEKYIYQNEKIRELFTKIDVNEISKDSAFAILLDQAIVFEKRYKVTIPYETVIASIEKSNFYITAIPFPEKSLQLLDWICVYTVQTLKKDVVTPDVVDTVITGRTHVPTTLSGEIKKKLLHMEELMQKRIIGQTEAINEVSSTIRRSFLLIGKRKKPIATYLFLGPTGVGKTETAKVIAEVFFGNSDHMVRFDMSVFQSKEDISKLIGSIETLNPGLLTNAIRENPYGVLLIDEIEKANRDLINIFLTILDEGYFTDGYGQRVDCKNLIIVATSNAGAQDIHQLLLKQSMYANTNKIGLSEPIMNYLIEKRLFSPEFLNRFDGIIAFKPLAEENALVLAKTIVKRISNELFELHKVHIQIADTTLSQFISRGYNPQFGVRNLERIMRSQIEDKVAKIILEGKAQPGQIISL